MKKTQIIVHHTASKTTPGSQQIHGVDNFHRDKDWDAGPGVAKAKKSRLGFFVQYHYFIEENGQVIKTADHDENRWHAAEQNDTAIGVCLAGSFDPGGNAAPSAAQTAALQKLLREIANTENIKPERIFPHRKYASKSCYGRNLSDTWAADLARQAPAPQPQPQPPQEPTMPDKLHEVLFLTQNVDQGIKESRDIIASVTGEDINIEALTQPTTRKFKSVTFPGVVCVDPNQIAEEAAAFEKATGKQINTVCLLYNEDDIEGPRPTNPVQNGIFINGYTVIQMPSHWYTDYTKTPTEVFIYSFKLFFIHELLHAWYYHVNRIHSPGKPDRVHESNTGFNDPIEYFKSLILELKPFWPTLLLEEASGQIEPQPNPEPAKEKKMFAFKHKGTVYVQIFAKFVPISDENTFLELGGSWNYVKDLSDAEFNSIIKPYLAEKSVLG